MFESDLPRQRCADCALNKSPDLNLEINDLSSVSITTLYREPNDFTDASTNNKYINSTAVVITTEPRHDSSE